jgi:hypothetical protein
VLGQGSSSICERWGCGRPRFNGLKRQGRSADVRHRPADLGLAGPQNGSQRGLACGPIHPRCVGAPSDRPPPLGQLAGGAESMASLQGYWAQLCISVQRLGRASVWHFDHLDRPGGAVNGDQLP